MTKKDRANTLERRLKKRHINTARDVGFSFAQKDIIGTSANILIKF